MKNKKAGILLSVLLVLSLSVQVFASDVSMCIYGSEKKGYRVSSGNMIHREDKTFSYNISYMDESYQKDFKAAMKKWNSVDNKKYSDNVGMGNSIRWK